MKKIYFTIIAAFIGIIASAQTTSVKGTVLDAQTHLGECFATLQFFKANDPSAIIAYTMTGEDGSFQYDLAGVGEYVLLFSNLGRADVSIPFVLDGSEVCDLGNILVEDDAELLIVGFGGTFGHLYSAMEAMNKAGRKVALAHFQYLNPLPKNTSEVLRRYPKVVVAEQNLGQFAGYLRMKVDGFAPSQFNQVKGQPFVVSELVDSFTALL